MFDIMLEGFADSDGDADMPRMIYGTVIRAHRCAAGLKGGCKIRRSAGPAAVSQPKIHLRVNADGTPIAVEATPGEAHEARAHDDLMGQRDSDPGALLADKGHDSDAIQRDLRDRGASPEIPTKNNRLVKYSVFKPLYAPRARVECSIGHLREQRPNRRNDQRGRPRYSDAFTSG